MSSLPRQRTFLGHPIGLYVLFFTEMWERFSYYGMRALLILYMVNYMKWAQKDASTVYKVYTSFVYVTPILGGYLADRYLGNRKAVIIGAVLMAIGHFLMAFEEYPIFLSALIFLILGNGMFKPNMSTQVGRLYPTNDGRRDGAYTIFYMGINLGAFLSPLACGWLAENTQGGYHSGFTLAGIGMVCGLLIYLFGQPFIREVDSSVVAGGQPAESSASATPPPAGEVLTEAAAESQPSALGRFANLIPLLLTILGVAVVAAAPILWRTKVFDQWDAIMLGIGGGCLLLIAYVCAQVRGGLRDRVLAILVLGVFVMFFWAAYEQAGNVLNIWADKNTDRYLWHTMPAPDVVPTVAEDPPKAEGEPQESRRGLLDRFRTMFLLKPPRPGAPQLSWGQWFEKSFNPVPTAWFQSINALAIFLIAPLFAWLWIWLDRRDMQPSIAMKMVIGLVLMSASVSIMVAAANRENQLSIVSYRAAKLPAGLTLGEGGKVAQTNKETSKVEPFHAGRLTFDQAGRELRLYGVLPDNERDLIIEKTAPEEFQKKVKELADASKKIDDTVKSVSVKLDTVPPGFDMKYAGLKKSVVSYDPKTQTLTAYQPLQDKEVKVLLMAAGEPGFRDTLNDLYVQSNTFVVSYWWLFWSYILATLGELCLSPVGLSMVSKLAPARFATMLMGVWMLTSAFGNFAAGWLGEVWGTIPPTEFFWWTTGVVGVAALVLLGLVRWVVAMMHGVK